MTKFKNLMTLIVALGALICSACDSPPPLGEDVAGAHDVVGGDAGQSDPDTGTVHDTDGGENGAADNGPRSDDGGQQACSVDGDCSYGEVCVDGWCLNPKCGDGICSSTENYTTCPSDCASYCGDNICNPATENAGSCSSDCTPYCGDQICTTGLENAGNCPGDCPATCGDDVCSYGAGEGALTCPSDCPALCGDGNCTGSENVSNCPMDCEAFCGDNVCTGTETSSSCPGDCPVQCDPDCLGKVCGSDGCGGICGACAVGQTCTDFGQCVGLGCPTLPCPSGFTCNGGLCLQDPNGGCTSAMDCPAGMSCDLGTGICFDPGTCTADCGGKACGSDGCGGSCGGCGAGQVCTDLGSCVAVGCSVANPCPAGYSCQAGTCVQDPINPGCNTVVAKLLVQNGFVYVKNGDGETFYATNTNGCNVSSIPQQDCFGFVTQKIFGCGSGDTVEVIITGAAYNSNNGQYVQQGTAQTFHFTDAAVQANFCFVDPLDALHPVAFSTFPGCLDNEGAVPISGTAQPIPTEGHYVYLQFGPLPGGPPALP